MTTSLILVGSAFDNSLLVTPLSKKSLPPSSAKILLNSDTNSTLSPPDGVGDDENITLSNFAVKLSCDCSTPLTNTLISLPSNAIGLPLRSRIASPLPSTLPNVVWPAVAISSYWSSAIEFSKIISSPTDPIIASAPPPPVPVLSTITISPAV